MDSNDITKDISKSRDSLFSAIESLKRFKSDNLSLLFYELRRYLKQSSELKDLFQNEELKIWDVYTDSENAIKYFYIENKKWPCVNLLTKFENNNVCMSIRIEISDNDGSFYVGIVTHSSKGGQETASTLRKKNIYFNRIQLTKNGEHDWWLHRDYIRFNGEPINFIYLNKAYAELFNDETGEKNRAKVYPEIVKEVVVLYNALKQNDVFFNNGLN